MTPSDRLEQALAFVRPDRIAALIDDFAALTAPGAGVTRLGYTPLERDAHRHFAETMSAAGLTVSTDPAGNTIAELAPGPGPAGFAAAVGTGSHLDSVPHGGAFDGIAGVVAGMAVAEAMVAAAVPHRRPWRFVVFANEEGARFGQACNGSRAAAGLATAAELRTLRDQEGVTLAEAMESVGLDPERAAVEGWHLDEWSAFVELHIEQGNVLESSGTRIGVVDCISGSSRLAVELRGVASHSGATPMHLRQDALAAAAECVLEGERIANDPQHCGTRVTVGRLEVLPGSITTIPGIVRFTVDVRDLDSDRQRCTARALASCYAVIAGRRGIEITAEAIGDTSPTFLHTEVVDAIAVAAKEHGVAFRTMTSGASHDAQQIGRIVPTGMLFVPSHDGLSHVPEEWTSTADLVLGAQVLLRTLLALDARDVR